MWRAAVAVLTLALSAAAGAHASFPGSNGRIAYSSFATDDDPRAIHTMTASGGQDQQLTSDGSARNPAWSASGRLIAFDLAAADGDGPAGLYVMRADGSDEYRVPTRDLDARNPAWSPNGRRLVFQGCKSDSECQQDSIFVVRRRGGGLRKIAAQGEDPVWAPNGNWIAYTGKLREKGCRTVVLMRPSGRRKHAIFSDDPNEQDVCPGAAGMDFAPDSRSLVYLTQRARRAGSFPDPITGEMHPLYTYDHELYTVRLNGKDRHLIARRALEDSGFILPPFVWSPDGEWVLWRDDRGTFVSHPDGGGRRRMGGASDEGADFAWQPLPER